MNINLFLQNSVRSDVFGPNLAIRGGCQKENHWDKPCFGLNGIFACGHQTNLSDVLTLDFYESEKKLSFNVVRNKWTPAWMETYYRSTSDTAYYNGDGCICISEKKCFLENDTFISHITINNDKREEVKISVHIGSPIQNIDGVYRMNAETNAAALGRNFKLNGFCSFQNSVSSAMDFTVTVPSGGKISFGYSFAYSPISAEIAKNKTEEALAALNPFLENEKYINKWFEQNAPELECENPDIMKVYYYRWFLIFRALHKPADIIPEHFLKDYCFYESPFGGWYGCPVGLPVPLHIEETKWMKQSHFTKSDINNWKDKLGNYQHYIQYTPMAILYFYRTHPDKEWLKDIYPACKEFSLRKVKLNEEGLQMLPVTQGSWLTGAEYQPSFYQWTTPQKWDWTQDAEGKNSGLSNHIQCLYRLDEICYTIGNILGCTEIAREIGNDKDCRDLSDTADKMTKTLKKYFWNEDKKFFYDIDAVTEKQCDEAGCYDSFFPFLWGIAGKNYIAAFDKLFSFKHFYGNYSVTTVEKTCPMYWFDNCITGPANATLQEPHQYGCCWNGAVWPYANSLVLEALGHGALNEKTLREKWLDLFSQYTDLHFMGGDRSLPVIVEHYRNTDGVNFSNVSDYFHSTWIDLFMKYWAGIEIENDGTIKFEPFTDEKFKLKDVVINNTKYTFKQTIINDKLIQECNIVV